MPSPGAAKAFAAWIASHPEPHADRPDEVFAAGFEAALKQLKECAAAGELAAKRYGPRGVYPPGWVFPTILEFLRRLIHDIQEGTWPTT